MTPPDTPHASPSRGWLLLAVCTAVYAASSAIAVARAPERVPMHFGADGDVDRWGSRMGLVVFLAVMGVALPALFAGLMWAFSRSRHLTLLNMPGKEQWLGPRDLPRARALAATDVAVIGALTMLFLAVLPLQLVHSALSVTGEDSSSPRAPAGVTWWAVTAFVVWLLAVLGWTWRSMRIWRAGPCP